MDQHMFLLNLELNVDVFICNDIPPLDRNIAGDAGGRLTQTLP